MADVKFSEFVAGLSADSVGGSEKIPVIDTTPFHVTPALLAAYVIDQLHGAEVITALTDAHQLSVFTSGDDEKIITLENVSAWIVDELEAITAGSTIISGDTVLYVDGGVLKQLDIATILAFVNSSNGTLGAQIAALSSATLADADEYVLSQSGTAKKTTFSAIAARVHSQLLTYLGTLSSVTALVDANTFYINQGGTAKNVTATILAEYILAEIKSAVLASAWDDYAALGGAANATDVFLLERSGTGKTATGANLAAYVVGTQSSASAASPAATGDDFLMFRSGTQYQVDIDVLAAYIQDNIWAQSSGTPVVDADKFAIGRSGDTKVVTATQLQAYVLTGVQATALSLSALSQATLTGTDLFPVDASGTAKKTTLTALETKLWTDYATYVAALTAVVTPLDADLFPTIQGGTPKYVTADVLASYMDDELWADCSAASPAVAGDVFFMRRSGTSYSVNIDVLATYINTSVQDGVLTFSGLAAAVPNAADLFALDDSGTPKKITLANLETKLWTDFATYVAAQSAVVTVADNDKLYLIQGGTPKYVTPVELAAYIGLAALDIDGLTDLGSALQDADLLVVDDGGIGQNRKSAMSRVWTYITTKIQGLTAKTAPVAADILTIQDSEDSDALKGLTLGDLHDNRYLSTGLETTAGAGITDAAETYVAGVDHVGSFFKTTIVIDLAGLRSSTAGDIIGKNGTALACHIGQITTEKNGVIFAGKIECLETPAGGNPDIDLFSATAATGVEDQAITALVETQLIDAGNHAANAFKSLTAFPAPDEYLYLVAGATTDADYTAGILAIELWGRPYPYSSPSASASSTPSASVSNTPSSTPSHSPSSSPSASPSTSPSHSTSSSPSAT